MGDLVGYMRVSTLDQDVAGQRKRLKQAGVVRTFKDTISGKAMKRPGLDKMLDYVRCGDTIVVVRLDRLGRSLKELIELVKVFQERGLAFRSLEENLDTSSAAGELVFHVFGAIAQFERRLIVERTKDGIAAAKAAGKVVGRPALDEERLASAITLVQSGVSPTKAAQQVGLGRSTLYRELKVREIR